MKNSLKNKHKAQACVLFCMDFRFKNKTLSYLEKELGLKDYDIIVAAGASKNIANPKELTDYQFIIRQIQLSIQLHEIDKIVLINHADCGAYGSAAFFGGEDKEKRVHARDLLRSKKLIEKRFSDQEIILVYAALVDKEGLVYAALVDKEGNEEIVFEKIKNIYPQQKLKQKNK